MRSEVPHLYCVILGAGFVVGGSDNYSTAIIALIGEVVRSGRRAVDSCYGFLRICSRSQFVTLNFEVLPLSINFDLRFRVMFVHH
jgi:hypothetical protein